MSYNSASRDIDGELTIRVAQAGDPQGGVDAARLAALDSAPVPAPPYVIASVGGEAIALRSLASGATVADPFARTAEVLPLLELRARQMGQAASIVARVVARRRRLGLRTT